MKRTILAVAYYRMSDNKQEMSIPDQRRAVEEYARKHGYAIIREYRDEGISGDATRKRLGFQQMIADAERGQFAAILCWDQDRFGRFDSIEAGRWVYPLREAGVQLVTVSQGVIDWNSFAGRVMYGIQTEAKHQYLTDLSRNVTRGMLRMAKEGRWASGKPSIGYQLDENKTLVLGPSADVDFVRWLFQAYLGGKSLRGLSIELHEQGRLSPRGKFWSAVGIASLLKNRIYLGEYTWNKRCLSKYKKTSRQSAVINNESEWVVIRDHHPAIIDQLTFDRVQEALSARKRASTPLVNGGAFVFSGLLRCAKCGSAMMGEFLNNAHYGYYCSGYAKRGLTFCTSNRIRQDELLGIVIDKLEQAVFNKSTMARLTREVHRQVASRASGQNASEVKRDLCDVELKLSKAKRRLVEVESDLVGIVQDQIRDLMRQRERLTNLTSSSELHSPNSIDAQVTAAMNKFGQLRRTFTMENAIVVRSLFQQWIQRIDVHTERIKWTAKRFKHRLSGGEIYFDPKKLLAGDPKFSTYTARSVAHCNGTDGADRCDSRTGTD